MATARVSWLQIGDALPPVALVSWLQIDGPPVSLTQTAKVSWLQIDGSPASIAADAPSAVVGSASSHNTSAIAWTPAASGGTPDGFDVQYESPTGSGNWVTAAGGSNPTGPGVTSFPVTGQTSAMQVTPRVRALRAGHSPSLWTVGSPYYLDVQVGGGGTLGASGGSGAVVQISAAGGGTSPYLSQSGSGAQVTISAAGGGSALPSIVAPSVVTHPQSASVAEGSTVTLTTLFSGNPTPTLQWRKNGVDINGATSTTHQFVSTAADNNAVFTVVGTNAGGTATTTSATLGVFPAVSITQHPTSTSVAEGQSATFTISVASQFSIAFQWLLNGSPIQGATGASLVLSGLTTQQSGGSYSCRVTSLGTTLVSSAAVLTVSALSVPITIQTQPAGIQVLEGSPVAFSVSVTGSTPVFYQWRRNGVSINGAVGSSYAIAAVELSDDGAFFSVAVTNALGTVVSAAAPLSVTQSMQTGLPYSLELADWRPGRVVTPSRTPFFAPSLISGGTDYFAFDFSSMLRFDYLESAQVSVSRHPMNLSGESTTQTTGVVHGGFVACLVSGVGRSGQYIVTCRANANGGRVLAIAFRLFIEPGP